jgi:hypothetical protein
MGRKTVIAGDVMLRTISNKMPASFKDALSNNATSLKMALLSQTPIDPGPVGGDYGDGLNGMVELVDEAGDSPGYLRTVVNFQVFFNYADIPQARSTSRGTGNSNAVIFPYATDNWALPVKGYMLMMEFNNQQVLQDLYNLGAQDPASNIYEDVLTYGALPLYWGDITPGANIQNNQRLIISAGYVSVVET